MTDTEIHQPEGVSRRRILRPRPIALLAAVLALSLSSTLVANAAVSAKHTTSHATQASTALKPDYKYFYGKTITLVVTSGVTGTSYLTAAGLIPTFESQLHATVNIEQVVGDSVVPQDIAGHASPDALTIGLATLSNYVLASSTGIDPLSFPLLSVGIVGTVGPPPYLVVSCHNPAITTFDQLVHSSTPVVNLQSTTLGEGSLLDDALMQMYNIPHTYIKSYTSASLEPGCERGDGLVAVTNSTMWLNSAGNAPAPGAIPLLATFPIPKTSPQYAAFGNVPTIASYIKAHPPKSALGKRVLKVVQAYLGTSAPFHMFFTAKGAPKRALLALQDTFTKAAKTPAFTNVLTSIVTPPGSVPVTTVKAWINTQLKLKPAMQALLARP